MDPAALRALALSMPVIEQAKGVLMGCYGCDPEAAFAILTRVSSTTNLKLRDLAAMVVEAVSHPNGTGGESDHGSSRTPSEQVRLVLRTKHTDDQGYRP